MTGLVNRTHRRFDLLSVGEVLVDFVAPDAAHLESAGEFIRTPGGAPANVAVAAARLGSRAAFAGAVGDDPFGRSLGATLRSEGVETSGLRTVPHRTTLAFVAKNQGGIPDFVFYRGADAELRPEDIPTTVLVDSFFLYASSMAFMSRPSSDATEYAIEVGREAGVLIAVDPNLRPSSWPSLEEARTTLRPLIKGADVLKVNDEEARLFTDTRDLDDAMAALTDERTLLVVTLGADGCRWRLGEHGGSVPSPRVSVQDTTGAGDAFMGALLAELALQNFSPSGTADLHIVNLENALRFACAAGALSCSRPGAMSSLPTRDEVDALVR